MKRFFVFMVIGVFILMAPGCATTKLATRVGAQIADTYQEAATKGTVTAEQSIDDLPYISGLIKGLFADNYDLDSPMAAKNIIEALDQLVVKEGWDR